MSLVHTKGYTYMVIDDGQVMYKSSSLVHIS